MREGREGEKGWEAWGEEGGWRRRREGREEGGRMRRELWGGRHSPALRVLELRCSSAASQGKLQSQPDSTTRQPGPERAGSIMGWGEEDYGMGGAVWDGGRGVMGRGEHYGMERGGLWDGGRRIMGWGSIMGWGERGYGMEGGRLWGGEEGYGVGGGGLWDGGKRIMGRAEGRRNGWRSSKVGGMG